ncbi:MAG TPA: hypothetical protein VFW07_22465 [Parafilimonas sp.]|nr:hypothetical protein [Parafilimonas sp.]
MATKKKAGKPAYSKKELKKELAGKIESVLSELKNTLGEKEFQHRIKKAAKILVHGLHIKEISASSNGTPANAKKTTHAKKIKGVKKAKSNPKETAV